MSDLYPLLLQERSIADWMESHAEELHEAGGVIPDEILGLIEANDAEFSARVETLVQAVKNLRAMADVAGAESARLRDLAASRKRKADTIQRNILRAMKETGRAKVETDLCDVRRQRSPVSVLYTGERGEKGEKIPDRYIKITYDFDAALAKKMWSGLHPEEPGEVEVPGEPITLIRGEHLRVK